MIGLMMVAFVMASKSRPSRGFKKYSPYPEPTYSGYAYVKPNMKNLIIF